TQHPQLLTLALLPSLDLTTLLLHSVPTRRSSYLFIKSRYIRKEEVQECRRNKHKPQQVRHDKIFIKRYIFIQRYLDHMVMRGHMLLQIQKPRHVNENIQEYPSVFILFRQISESLFPLHM